MAKAQVKKAQVQAENAIFALDIGTRSLIGMVGTVEEDRVKIIAIERAEHAERAMIDGQIENIEKVSGLAKKVKKKLEDRVGFRLSRVSVAAAGRALRTERAEYEMELPRVQTIDDEMISRLERRPILAAKESTVYPLLRRLLGEGYLTSSWQESSQGLPPRKYYAVTERGMDYLAAMSGEWESLLEAINEIKEGTQHG